MSLTVVLVENRYDWLPIWQKHEPYLPDGAQLHVHDFVNCISEYNLLLTSKEFWNELETENVLIIQHDSALLRSGIEEFYEYDYVGAPWKFQEHGGNGGLSLRKKSAMIKCIEQVTYNGIDNEDVYFCNALKELGMNLAPREVCEKFSCESIFKLGTVGYHAVDTWLASDECEEIRNQYNG